MRIQRWQHVFRLGLAPCLSDPDLAALADGLERDDSRLLQGATCSPPPLACVQDWPCEAACPVAYPYLALHPEATVAEVEQWFVDTCCQADLSLGEPAASRWLLNFADDTDRTTMRAELLAEVRLEMARRDTAQKAALAPLPT